MVSPMWIVIGVIAVFAITGRTIVAIIKASNQGANLSPGWKRLRNTCMTGRAICRVPDTGRGAGKIVTDQKYDLGLEIDDLASS